MICKSVVDAGRGVSVQAGLRVHLRSRSSEEQQDSQDHGSSTTTAKGLSHGLHHQGHSPRHRRRRGIVLAHAGSPPLQHISAVWSCCYRLHLSRSALSPCTTSSWYVYVMRTMVQVRRVRWGPPPDPMPFVLYKMPYASTSSSLLGASGEEVLLCSRF